ncbi:hypothetical protein B566_EDAN005034 [Ephemera danica]|nr:hypothetical protein B566_EDAN005034 [Ephemera danica]
MDFSKNPPSSPYYSHPPVSQVTSTTVSYAPTSGQPVYSYANSGHPQYAQPPPGAPAPPRDEAGKHASASIFLPHGQQPPQQAQGPPRSLPQHGQVAYVGLHPPLEHGSQKPAFSAQEAEKYYAVAPNHPSGVTIRPATHVPIHGGSIPIQQAPQGAKSGGITSGYPIRGQPSPHVTSGSYQPSVSTPHSVYVSQAPAPRLSYSQSTSQQQQQHPQNHVQNAGPPPPPPHGSNPAHGPAPGQHGPSPGRYNVPGLQREV